MTPSTGTPVFFSKEFKAGRQQTQVTAEFIDDEPLDPFPFGNTQELQSPDQRSKDSPLVNIPHQQHGSADGLCDSHVGEVPFAQVDFCRASSSFDHDHRVPPGQSPVTFQDRCQCLFLEVMILTGIHVAEDFPLNDDLRPDIRVGLEKDGIHIHMGVKPGRLGLHHLGPAHLPSLRGNKRIKGHVLGLERGDLETILLEQTAQAGDDDALAHERAGSLDH